MHSMVHLKAQKAPENVEETYIHEANKLVSLLIWKILQYLDRKPPSDIKSSLNINFDAAFTENEWTRLLLLNIFDGCAMTYQGSESQSLHKMDGQHDKIVGHPCVKYIVGSMFEGIGCASPDEYSDTDIMNVLKDFIALQKSDNQFGNNMDQLPTETNKSTYYEPQDSKKSTGKKYVWITNSPNPGYVQVLDLGESKELLRMTESLNHGPVIRSQDTENLLAHTFEFDNAIAVECKCWPLQAISWKSRKRKSDWPSSRLISECCKLPCTIVSKSHPQNKNNRHEWRYSFTKQEGILLRSLDIEVRMVYIITKVLLKQTVLKGDTLSSYHIKTTFLWYCENVSVDDFKNKDMELNVKDFLKFLVKRIQINKIENYFIEERNMISHISEEDIRSVECKIEYLLENFLDELSNVKTAKQYPFASSFIARDLKTNGLENNKICHQKLQSNFLFSIMDHLFKLHLPNSHLMWTYIQYIPVLINIWKQTTCESTFSTSDLIQTAMVSMKPAFKIFSNELSKLLILFCSLVEINESEEKGSKMLLETTLQLQDDDLLTSLCIADTICLISTELGVSATERCCMQVIGWTISNKAGKDIFMLTLKNIITLFGTAKSDNNEHLMSCLVALVNVLQISKNDIEVGMASTLRLNSSIENIKRIYVLCNLMKKAEMNNVLKQLVYLTVLFLESKDPPKEILKDHSNLKDKLSMKQNTEQLYCRKLEDSSEHEAMKAIKAAFTMISSGMLKTAKDAFRLVFGACVFQKLTLENPDKETVKSVLRVMKATKQAETDNDINELQTDIESLVTTEIPQLEMVFQFLVFYTRRSIVSAGLAFTSSVLDELVKPHFNLGVISAAGRELIAEGEIDKSIETIELWITRSTGAPITQNPILRVKMYGNLGHLYHIKAVGTVEIEEKARLIDQSSVLFYTALKENERDIAVEVDFLIFLLEQRRYEELESCLEKTCVSSDITSISNYYHCSIQVFNEMDDIKELIECNGQMNVSGVVLARFIQICHDEMKREKVIYRRTSLESENKIPDQLLEIQKCVDVLSMIYIQIKMTGGDSAVQLEVLVDTTLLLGLAAIRLEKYDFAEKTFKNVLTLNPSHEIAKLKLEKLRK